MIFTCVELKFMLAYYTQVRIVLAVLQYRVSKYDESLQLIKWLLAVLHRLTAQNSRKWCAEF